MFLYVIEWNIPPPSITRIEWQPDQLKHRERWAISREEDKRHSNHDQQQRDPPRPTILPSHPPSGSGCRGDSGWYLLDWHLEVLESRVFSPTSALGSESTSFRRDSRNPVKKCLLENLFRLNIKSIQLTHSNTCTLKTASSIPECFATWLRNSSSSTHPLTCSSIWKEDN